MSQLTTDTPVVGVAAQIQIIERVKKMLEEERTVTLPNGELRPFFYDNVNLNVSSLEDMSRKSGLVVIARINDVVFALNTPRG